MVKFVLVGRKETLLVVVAFTTSVNGAPARMPTEIGCALSAAMDSAASANTFLILTSLVSVVCGVVCGVVAALENLCNL